jgi:hypothetical protein
MEVWRPCLQRGPGAEPLALFFPYAIPLGCTTLGWQVGTAFPRVRRRVGNERPGCPGQANAGRP